MHHPTLTGSWHIAPNAQVFPLPGNWQGLFVPGGVVPLAVLNDPAYELWSRFRERQELAALGLDEEETRALREMASVGLLRPQPSLKPQIRASQSAILASWLHLTDRCNLDCAYCYLPHKPEDMSPSTGRAAIDATFRSVLKHGYQKVKFKYAGGEPLLRFPLLLELHRYAQELAEEHQLALDGVVLSNGTLLTEEMVAQLQALGLRLMISLDGVGIWHDVQRPYLGGRGSFMDVEEGVELALAARPYPRYFHHRQRAQRGGPAGGHCLGTGARFAIQHQFLPPERSRHCPRRLGVGRRKNHRWDASRL